MRKLANHWMMLDVYRANPDGVDSLFLVKNHVKLYHKWASRNVDTLVPMGYDITEGEHLYEWVYKWRLKNPEFMHEKEKIARGLTTINTPAVKPFVDERGNMNFDFNQPLS